MPEVIKYAFGGEMMQVVNENVTRDVNVCGDVQTRLGVFEIVQREAKVIFFLLFVSILETSLNQQCLCKVSLFVINFITAVARQMLGL